MVRNIIGPLFNFKNCVFFFVFGLFFQKSSFFFCRENENFENKKKTKKQKKDHFLTLRAKMDHFLTLQHIYIHIYT